MLFILFYQTLILPCFYISTKSFDMRIKDNLYSFLLQYKTLYVQVINLKLTQH